jgi:O-antigen ligase
VIRRTAFDGPLLLFLLSAVWGAWLAYDQKAGWAKFSLIVGGLVIYYGIAQIPKRVHVEAGSRLSPFRLLFLMLPSAIASYFLLTNEWTGGMPGSWGHRLHPNQAGGIIAVFLPFQIAALGFGKRSPVAIWIAVPLLALSALGLLMSAARGAWLALAMVAAGWALGFLNERLTLGKHSDQTMGLRRNLWIIAPMVGGLIIFLVLLATPVGAWLQGFDSGRVVLWHDSLDLASDYLFSGLGLSSFQMPYSSYVILLHVVYLSHAHNLLLDVWLEQGVLGLLAVVWLFTTAAWQNPSESSWQKPALASLGVVLLHGLVDDAFYGYDGTGILLLFVPFALLAGPVETPSPVPRVLVPKRSGLSLVPFLGLGLVLLAVAALLLLPGWQAAWQANLGALAQTQAELSVYRWPEWPVQDAVRRSSEIDLTPALHRYRAALAHNPANVTANRRLGQIELSLGQYAEARKHLEVAYAIAPGQRATRQLLGESYAVTGDIEQAAVLWRTVDSSLKQLELRWWWYDYIGEPERAAWVAEAAALAASDAQIDAYRLSEPRIQPAAGGAAGAGVAGPAGLLKGRSNK